MSEHWHSVSLRCLWKRFLKLEKQSMFQNDGSPPVALCLESLVPPIIPASLSPLASGFNPSANELALAKSQVEKLLEEPMPTENFAKRTVEMCGLKEDVENLKSTMETAAVDAMETAVLDALNDEMENLKSTMKSIHEEMETFRREHGETEEKSPKDDDVFGIEEMCDDDIDEDAYEDKDEDHSDSDSLVDEGEYAMIKSIMHDRGVFEYARRADEDWLDEQYEKIKTELKSPPTQSHPD